MTGDEAIRRGLAWGPRVGIRASLAFQAPMTGRVMHVALRFSSWTRMSVIDRSKRISPLQIHRKYRYILSKTCTSKPLGASSAAKRTPGTHGRCFRMPRHRPYRPTRRRCGTSTRQYNPVKRGENGDVDAGRLRLWRRVRIPAGMQIEPSHNLTIALIHRAMYGQHRPCGQTPPAKILHANRCRMAPPVCPAALRGWDPRPAWRGWRGTGTRAGCGTRAAGRPRNSPMPRRRFLPAYHSWVAGAIRSRDRHSGVSATGEGRGTGVAAGRGWRRGIAMNLDQPVETILQQVQAARPPGLHGRAALPAAAAAGFHRGLPEPDDPRAAAVHAGGGLPAGAEGSRPRRTRVGAGRQEPSSMRRG